MRLFPLRRLSHVALLAFGLLMIAPTAAAQRTWIVDAYNGPGADFSDIRAAITAAADGDIIRVRFGTYTLPSGITRPLTIVGENHPVLLAPIAFAVGSIPYDREFVLKDLGLAALLSITVGASAGRIHCDDVDFGSSTVAALTISDCRYVTLNRCTFANVGSSSAALEINGGSSVIMSECSATGGDALLAGGSPAISVRDGSLLIIGHSTIVGGNATRGGTIPREAIAIRTNSRVELLGDDTTRVTAGSAWTASPGTYAIIGDGSSTGLQHDPRNRIEGSGGSPAISNVSLVTQRSLATLRAAGTTPGHSIRVAILTAPGSPSLLLAGSPSQPLFLPGLGYLFINPSLIYQAGAGVGGSNGLRFENLPIPNFALTGQPVTLQAIYADISGPQLTVPTVVVIG